MDAFIQAICIFCAVTGSAPQPQVARGAGDIWFTQETIGRDTRLLRLSTTDFILDHDGGRNYRLNAFATQYAERTCRGRYDLNRVETAAWPDTHPRYAAEYTLRCR